ncbi:MAG: thioredoxin family protein [Bacteroidia bacterium]|nr:thioredoxin family protein [Bacteroidia bacterium]
MNIIKYISSVILISLLGLQASYAQLEDPVDWSITTKDLGGGKYLLELKANVDPGWHIYSQFTADGGPEPTSLNFEEKENVSLIGKSKEYGEVETSFDDLFGVDVSTFKGNARITQELKVTGEKGKIVGYVRFMVCNDEKCLPPSDEEFSFDLKGVVEKSIDQSTNSTKVGPKEATTPKKQIAKDTDTKLVQAQPTIKKEDVKKPEEKLQIVPQLEADPNEEIFSPVEWTINFAKVEKDMVDLIFSAKIKEGWKIYSPDNSATGPIPFTVIFEEEQERIGKVKYDQKPQGGFDKFFNVNVDYFKGSVNFSQRIRVKDTGLVKGFITYSACNKDRCLPPDDLDFNLDVSQGGVAQLADPSGIFLPNDDGANPFKRDNINRENPVSNCEEEEEFTASAYSNLLSLFLLGLVGGMFAFLTPCVFPMVPLTVGFFSKSSENKKQGILNGVVYGLSIFLIYTLVSLPFHLIPGLDTDVFNLISTDPILNTIFFVVFVIFAFSFFGFFEITLPSALANSVDQKGSARGFIGIFIMALTLAIVSFSCTGPLFGTVFVLSSGGFVTAWSVTAAAAGFGVALGLPFALFAIFPGLLNALPKSGGWMDTTKIMLGFIEIALALKFLSKAELVGNWGFLYREIFLGIWILIGVAMVAYLFGLYKFPHEYPSERLPRGRYVLGISTILLIAYIFPGFWGPAGIFSGILPPMTHSIFAEKNEDCPHNLDCFKDYEEGLAYAKSVNKPIMIDFTGHGCENCRKMEENVWPETDVYKYISEDYVLISLYVDERKKLEEPILVDRGNGKTKKLRTVGNKWTEFQVVNFFANSQPYYVLMSPEEVLLNSPKGYTPDADEYQNFLECGLDAFKQLAEK